MLKPKSEAGWRIIELPTWAVTMLKRRHADQDENEWQAVFTSPLGHLRDPSNTQGDLRDVFDRAKYPDIISHTFRRTVATLMDEAGLSARAAADQLGHAKVSMTQDHYYGRKRAKTGGRTPGIDAADRELREGKPRVNHADDLKPGFHDHRNSTPTCTDGAPSGT
jgi:integrase